MEFEVDPRKVLYSQDSIRSRFQNDEFIEDTIEQLVLGEISPEQIRRIRICTLNDKMHSLDNRRLYAFKEAINRGSSFKTVPAIRSYDFDDLQNKMSKSSPFNDWSKIRVRGKPRTQNRPSIYANRVSTRTQDKPNINVSTRIQDSPLYVDSLYTRTQDSTTICANSVPTKTQDRPNIYMNGLHTKMQDKPQSVVIRLDDEDYRYNNKPLLNTTETQEKPQNVVIRMGDDDYTNKPLPKITETQKKPQGDKPLPKITETQEKPQGDKPLPKITETQKKPQGDKPLPKITETQEKLPDVVIHMADNTYKPPKKDSCCIII